MQKLSQLRYFLHISCFWSCFNPILQIPDLHGRVITDDTSRSGSNRMKPPGTSLVARSPDGPSGKPLGKPLGTVLVVQKNRFRRFRFRSRRSKRTGRTVPSGTLARLLLYIHMKYKHKGAIFGWHKMCAAVGRHTSFRFILNFRQPSHIHVFRLSGKKPHLREGVKWRSQVIPQRAMYPVSGCFWSRSERSA